MVVVLQHQFFHLAQRVGGGFGHMLGDVGNLCPRDKTVFVAEVIEVLRVLVVGKAHGVGAHIPQNLHILLMLSGGQRIADPCAILMPRRAHKADISAVEPEACIRLERDFATAEVYRHRVTVGQRGSYTVQIRVRHAVPQVDVFHVEHGHSLAALHGGGLLPDTLDGKQNLGAVGGVLTGGFHRDGGTVQVVRHLRRHAQGGRAVVIQRKVTVRYNKDMYIAVQPAIEGKVRFLRVDRAVGAVVHRDSQRVLRSQRGGQVDAEGGIAARVARQLLVVQGDDCRHGGTLKFQPDLLIVGVCGGGKFLGIGAGPAEVIVAAVGAVGGVPCVGQGHSHRCRAGFCELPMGIEIQCAAHTKLLIQNRSISSCRASRSSACLPQM